ncbi:MAG: DUF1611 domain-containing protein [Thermoanaerobaculia bacterium]
MSESAATGRPAGTSAVLLAHGRYATSYGKTAHGLVRGPSRWPVAAVVDPSLAGRDAGEALDGRRRRIPIVASLSAAEVASAEPLTHCVVAVATDGGSLPQELKPDLLAAARRGLTLVNGLHEALADDPEVSSLARRFGGLILDLRAPRPARELRFWSGEVLGLATPRLPVLGTDCTVGKRTTCLALMAACRRTGLRAEIVYTGQTGWMQGLEYGFVLDATPNDFVCGELEAAVLACYHATRPDLILIEGQSALRNPAGPCGAELVLALGARGVLLQHDPRRTRFEGTSRPLPPLAEEVRLIELLGASVWAVTLHDGGLAHEVAEAKAAEIEDELGIPVVLPLGGGMDRLVALVRAALAEAA